MHDAHRAAGQVDGGGEHQQVVAHESDVGGLDRDGRTGRAHRDTDVRRGQGRGVVDAVSHHRHDVAVSPQPGDDVELVLGQQRRADLVDSDFGGHGLRHDRAVAGEHDDPGDPGRVQCRHHVCGVGAHLVGHGQNTDDDAVEHDDQRRAPAGGEFVGHRGGGIRVRDPVGAEQGRIADQHGVAGHRGDDALPGHRRDVFRQAGHLGALRGFAYGLLRGGLHDRSSQRMLGAGLRPRGPVEHLGTGQVGVQHHDVRQGRAASGEGAGLVDGDDGDLRGGLEELPALDQDSQLRGAADPGDYRDRDGDDQGAGAADHEQGQRQEHVTGHQADHDGEHQDTGGVPGREPVHEDLGRRRGLLGLLDPVHDLGQGGGRAHLGGQHLEKAAGRDRAGEDAVSGTLVHREGLARDGGLVERSGAGSNGAVDGHPRAVLDQNGLPGLHRPGRDLDLLAVPQHEGDVGGQCHERRQGGAGAVEGGRFEGVPEREQEGHGGGLPVFAEHDGADKGDRDEQVDADDPGEQRAPGGAKDREAGHGRGRHHRRVGEDGGHRQDVEQPGGGDQPAGSEGNQVAAHDGHLTPPGHRVRTRPGGRCSRPCRRRR